MKTDSPRSQPVDQEIDRKAVLKRLTASGRKLLLSTLPLSIIGLSAKKSFAQFSDLEIGRALNFILQIEFMQEAFYVQTTTTDGLLDPPWQSIFIQLRKQHQARVILVKNLIGSFDVNPAPQLEFNFRYSEEINPFSSFDHFLNVAQVIEDTASGVYQKQIATIVQNNPSAELKRLMLRLHTTESRHAYFIRNLRTRRGLDDIKGWIDRTDLGTLPEAFENIYRDESNTFQEHVDVAAVTEVNIQAIQEAWDEPIGRGPAGGILQLFTNPL